MVHLVDMAMASSSLAFFGIGDTEMFVIMVAILICFGGQKMPELARGLGKALREFRRATSEVEREFKRVMEEAENPPAPMPKYTPAATTLAAAPTQDLLPAAPTLVEGASGEPAMANVEADLGASGEVASNAAAAAEATKVVESGPGQGIGVGPLAPAPKFVHPEEDREFHSDV